MITGQLQAFLFMVVQLVSDVAMLILLIRYVAAPYLYADSGPFLQAVNQAAMALSRPFRHATYWMGFRRRDVSPLAAILAILLVRGALFALIPASFTRTPLSGAAWVAALQYSFATGGLGLLLGISQVVGNLPGGFAAMANFRDEAVARRSRMLIAGSFVAPVFLGAGIGFWLLRGTSELVQNAGLVFIAGVLLLATIEEMVPQADEPEVERWVSTIAFTLGFIFLVFLSAYLD